MNSKLNISTKLIATAVATALCTISVNLSFAKFLKRSIVLLAAFLLGGIEANAQVYNYSGGGTFTTIQAAINAASPSDILVIDDGTYAENIAISKTIFFSIQNAIINGNVILNSGQAFNHSYSFQIALGKTFTNDGLYKGPGVNGTFINNGTISPTKP
jgi:pectin methylesterase-like acyl-CoA thioesterase